MKTGDEDRRGGFTLIELLLVISIIMLLVAILSVAVHTPTTQSAAAIARMNSLSAALDAYRNVYGVYPPSNNKWAGYAPTYGAQCLYYFLMGPTGKGWTNAESGIPAEFTWQGAMNVSADWATTPATGVSAGIPYFNDGIQGGDRAILYYRAAWLVGQAQSGTLGGAPLATSTNSVGLDNYYNYNDNCDTNATYQSDSPFWPGKGSSPSTTANPGGYSKQQQWYYEITDVDKTKNSSTNANLLGGGNITPAMDQQYGFPQRAMTYILISAGLDREFGLPTDPSRGWASDDITNYTP